MELSERFAALLRRPEAEVPLDEVALVIAAHARPGLDIGAELARLDELAATCFAPTLDALVRHLFVDLGFRGNESDYYDPRNSYLDEVVDRRLGIPITLSVLTIEVGRRIGVPVAGVSLPGHFLLRDRVDADVFIDPFAGGAYLDQAGCERAFRALQGRDAPFDAAYLDPVGPYLIVARMLANLQAIFTNRGDDESLRWVLHLRSLTPGTQAARARARLN
jgi:regulator of sirC expression with transglutaminase-like and TPR domain